MKNNIKKRKPGRRDREKARERKTYKEKGREVSGEEEKRRKKAKKDIEGTKIGVKRVRKTPKKERKRAEKGYPVTFYGII
jgi:hypothetical protein